VQDRAIALMQELASGRILRGVIDGYPRHAERRAVDLRLSSVRRLLGIDVPVDEAMAILTSLGFAVEHRNAILRVVVPTYRRDVEREEDLIEEIARHHGYDRIPSVMPVEATAQGFVVPSLQMDELVRTVLVRAGLVEALTLSLTNPAALDGLLLPPDHPWRDLVPLRNPMVEDHTHLRTTLLPGLLNAARANVARGVTDIRLFELGRTFRGGSGVTEPLRLTMLMTGTTHEGAWSLPAQAVTIDFFTLKGVVEALLRELHAGDVSFTAARAPWLHAGRTAELAAGRRVLGMLGELHPDVAARYDLPAAVYIADIDADELFALAAVAPRFRPVSRFPAVRRDIAVVVPRDLPSAHVEQVIREAAGAWLEAVGLFDVYEGAPVPPGRRSLAYALTFRAAERTLAAEEVETRMRVIHDALRARLRAKIRE
jgi:phenylalanyl-tRNA synthetase beta chain